MACSLAKIEEDAECSGCGHIVRAGLAPFSDEVLTPPGPICWTFLYSLDVWLWRTAFIPRALDLATKAKDAEPDAEELADLRSESASIFDIVLGKCPPED